MPLELRQDCILDSTMDRTRSRNNLREFVLYPSHRPADPELALLVSKDAKVRDVQSGLIIEV
jgi:hypothetical protein